MSNLDNCYKSLTFTVILLFGALATFSTLSHAGNWTAWANENNTSNNSDSGISKGQASKLVELCRIDYTEDTNQLTTATQSTSSKPLIVGDMLYWTAFSGQVGAYRINRDADGNFTGCEEAWWVDVSNALGLTEGGVPVFSSEPATRVSPAYYERSNGEGTLLYTAYANAFTLPGEAFFGTSPIAYALDAATGSLVFQVPLVTNPLDLFPIGFGGTGESLLPATTSSPSIDNGVAYFGISSLNNALSFLGLTFRGQMIALDLDTDGSDNAAVKWVQRTIPPRPAGVAPGEWFAGGGVWASTPTLLPEKGLVIFASGQLYQYPDFVAECMSEEVIVDTPTFNTTLRGQTGGGARECYERATQTLWDDFGISHPIAANSVIALNMDDGSFAWHVPTAGIDSWQAECGLDLNLPGCISPVPGPDWDLSGTAPLVATINSETKIISHNKGGSIFWIDPDNGEVERTADVCVGSAVGGIHWGLSYDPERKILLASCAGGQLTPAFGNAEFLSITADGREVCHTGYLNAIDARDGKLLWQALPAANDITENGSCLSDNSTTLAKYSIDERFKYGIDFDIVHKNVVDPMVTVNVMPANTDIPLLGQHKAGSNGVPANSKGVAYWPVYNGVVYALDINNGKFLNEMLCDAGASYMGASTANGLVAFGCGYGFAGGPDDVGQSIMVYGLEKSGSENDD